MPMTLKQLQRMMEKDVAPYLPMGFIRTNFVSKEIVGPDRRVLSIDIGHRNVWVNEDGEVEATGTLMLDDDPQDLIEAAKPMPRFGKA